MFKLNSHVVIGNGKNCKPLIFNLIFIFRQKKLQKFILKQNDW